MRYDRPPNTSSGFTLVELMIAMTLVSMIMGMIYAAFSLALRGWEAIDTVSRDNEELTIAQTFLYQKLSQIRPMMGAENKQLRQMFRGGADELQFIATAPAHRMAADGLYVYQLRVRNDVLELVYDRNLTAEPLYDTDDQKAELVDSISTVSFSYFGRPEGKGEAGWHPQWDDKYRIPRLVKIDIERAGKMPPWPDIVIPLQAGQKL